MNIEVLRIDGSREKREAHKTGAMGVIHRLIGASCCAATKTIARRYSIQ